MGRRENSVIGRKEDIGAHYHNMGDDKPADWNTKMVSRRYILSEELDVDSALVYTRFLKSQN